MMRRFLIAVTLAGVLVRSLAMAGPKLAPAASSSGQAMAVSNLLLVSNRVPWSVAVADGVATLTPTSGGLATALSRVHRQSGTWWVGWPGDLGGLGEPERERVLEEMSEHRILPVEITAAEVAGYYERVVNGQLWPVFHAFPDQAGPATDDDWRAYESVNARFARAVASQAAQGAMVWVHDLHLMLVPRQLRQLRPDLRIGFFLHTPFPAWEPFRNLARHRELLQGVLGADLVGFQTAEHQARFTEAAVRILGADEVSRPRQDLARGADESPAAAPQPKPEPVWKGLRHQGRSTALGTYGIGIDAEAFAQAAASPGIAERAAELRREAGGRALVLGVDRLDYIKGIDQRLLAVERLLEQQPGRRGRFAMTQVAVPSRERVPAYQAYRKRVDEIEGRINAASSTPDWVPIRMVYRNLPFPEVVARYLAADVLMVTSLADGMNLVVKEFCASRVDGNGVLILSRFAGAAETMPEAIQVDPRDIDALALALDTALDMPAGSARERMQALRGRVFSHNVYEWAQAFMRDLEAQALAPDPAALAEAGRVVLFLDYDGTLVPFAPRPEDAAPDPELLALLARLAKIPNLEVHLVSGRGWKDLEAWFGPLSLGLHSDHGKRHREGPGAAWEDRIRCDDGWKQGAKQVMAGWCGKWPGSAVEEKTHSLAWHYRSAQPPPGPKELAALRESLSPEGLEWLEGAMVLELRVRGVHKGLAAAGVPREPGTRMVALGDDRTDEDLFQALPPGSLAIKVGAGPSCASARLQDPAAVRAFLAELAEALAVQVRGKQEGGCKGTRSSEVKSR